MCATEPVRTAWIVLGIKGEVIKNDVRRESDAETRKKITDSKRTVKGVEEIARRQDHIDVGNLGHMSAVCLAAI